MKTIPSIALALASLASLTLPASSAWLMGNFNVPYGSPESYTYYIWETPDADPSRILYNLGITNNTPSPSYVVPSVTGVYIDTTWVDPAKLLGTTSVIPTPNVSFSKTSYAFLPSLLGFYADFSAEKNSPTASIPNPGVEDFSYYGEFFQMTFSADSSLTLDALYKLIQGDKLKIAINVIDKNKYGYSECDTYLNSRCPTLNDGPVPIPEPSTTGLALAAAGSLLWFRRRKA